MNTQYVAMSKAFREFSTVMFTVNGREFFSIVWLGAFNLICTTKFGVNGSVLGLIMAALAGMPLSVGVCFFGRLLFQRFTETPYR